MTDNSSEHLTLTPEQQALSDAQLKSIEARKENSLKPSVVASLAESDLETKAFEYQLGQNNEPIYIGRRKQSKVAESFSKKGNPEDIVAGEARGDWDSNKG